MTTQSEGAGYPGDAWAIPPVLPASARKSGEMMIGLMLHDPWGRGRPEI